MSWAVYVARTGLDVEAWLNVNKITSHAKLCDACERLNVIPPQKSDWSALRPKQAKAGPIKDASSKKKTAKSKVSADLDEEKDS